jgi:CTP synthase (UTP-ammonia lyase)
VVVETARNVLGIEDADHAETSPDARRLAITPLVCSLVGQTHVVRLLPGTRAAALYGGTEAVEEYWCNYGLNPDYREALEKAGLRATGVGADGEVRIVELAGHPFFVGTLFLPQKRSAAGRPHPLLAGFASAVRAAPAAAR